LPKRIWEHLSANRPFWCIILLGVLFTVGNIVWLERNILTVPPPWDQAFYLYMSLRYLDALVGGGLLTLAREFVHLSPNVAPLFPLTTLPLYLLFGTSRLVAHLTSACYLWLLLVGVYLLGVYLHGRRAALLAVFCVATFPAVVNFSRDYLFEFPAAAVATLGLYALLRSEDLRHRSWCLLFGMLAGITILTKTMNGVFFVGPVLYTVALLIRRRQLDRARLTHGALAVGAGILVASIWWGPNFRGALGYLIYFGFKDGSAPYRTGGSDLLTVTNLSAYAMSLVNFGTSIFWALLFMVVIATRMLANVVGRGGRRAEAGDGRGKDGYLWAWFLVGYAILTVVPNKGGERYALPLLPPLALLLAGYIEGLRLSWVRRGMVIVAVVVGAFNYIGLTYGLPGLPQVVYSHPFAIVAHVYPHYYLVRNTVHVSADTRWPIPDVLAALSSQGDRDEMEGRAALKSSAFMTSKVLVVPDHPMFNASTLRYYAQLSHQPLTFFHLSEAPVGQDRLQEFRFVLVKEGGFQGPDFSTRYNDTIAAALRAGGSGFVPLPQRFSFPDGTDISIFVATSGGK